MTNNIIPRLEECKTLMKLAMIGETKAAFDLYERVDDAVSEIKRLRETIVDFESAYTDYKRLVREIDVIINGEDGAAKQASLCDLMGQIRTLAAARP